MAKEKINFTSRAVPSGPGSHQITADALESKKGGSSFVSKLPTKHVVPGDAKSMDKNGKK